MTNNNNLIPKENYKKVEEVREINNEIPSYEEFMKTYESDDNLNYDDLNSGSIGEVKGYGPNPDGCEKMLQTAASYPFELKVECYNWGGGGGYKYVYSTTEALNYANELGNKYFNVSWEVERKCAELVREAVWSRNHGGRVCGYLRVQGKLGGGYRWSCNYGGYERSYSF